MASLPKQVHKRLAEEFRSAAARVAESDEIEGKLYYFSVFFGETGRQLNMHWAADLALLYIVAQAATRQIQNRQPLPTGAGFSPDGLPEGFPQAIDHVSAELAKAFEGGAIELPRFYAALARIAELTYATTGNGAFLCKKGMIKL